MNETHESERDGLLEAWIDGRLGTVEARRFEARLEREPELAREAALARRIEGVLRERFAAPAEEAAWIVDLERFAARGAEATASSAPPRAVRAWIPVLVAAALAAALLLVLRTRLATVDPPVSPGAGPAVLTATLDAGALVPVGPLVDAAESRRASPLAVTSTNLEALYSEALAWASDGSQRVCGTGDRLAGALHSSYGESVELRPGAEGRLQGPFASDEWPTGMILAGASEGEPAVLVAERHDQLACCLNLELPPDSPLKVFTWRVGDLLLTEITPSAEPRLIDYIGEAY